ncbi:MAG: 3-phosphoserine/phosphohydroxythreonine transaminase [Desulfobacterales bacterium]
MKENRIFNFNAGPAALPLPVLEEIQGSFLNFAGSGMSIMEISHRSKWFDEVIEDAVARTRRILKLDNSYHVLFLQGGASMQFCMVPMNLLPEGKAADYVNTGTWSTKAIKEVKILGKKANVVASSEDKDFSYIPQNIKFNPDAAYVHITSNNTIKGTQWANFPDTGDVPLVSDMSSDFMSRPFDARPFGLIYAGAQKNIGPAGVCMVIIREDMLKRVPAGLPTMLKYTTHSEKNSMFNTPPCIAVYTVQLVLKWLEETGGRSGENGLINDKKAEIIYGSMDSTEFYRGTVEKESRSKMNVTFRVSQRGFGKEIHQRSRRLGIGGLKGHRSRRMPGIHL